jgi:hypothetical protein
VPYDVYAGCFWPSGCTVSPNGTTYSNVKDWALEVEDGYDARAVFNRQAIYGGALIAAASTSALVGLAAFNTAGNVIKALPIGATFLSGTFAIYNNEQKAVIYGSASQTIRDVLIQSDYKQASLVWKDPQPAICLHAEVSEVIQKVNNHITLLDPKNVADQLKNVAAAIQQKQTTAVNEQAAALAAQKRVNEVPKAQRAQAQAEADQAKIQANEANSEAKKAQDENTVQSLAAQANDFSDLQKLPDLKDLPPEFQTYCFSAATTTIPGASTSRSRTTVAAGASVE